jgi:xylulokinase
VKNETTRHRRFLVIDVGTSSLKAAISTESGTLLSSARTAVMASSESPVNFTGDRWLAALHQVVPGLVGGEPVDSVIISGNGPTIVAVDDTGNVVNPPLLWHDTRHVPLVTGSSFYLPKIAWLERESFRSKRVRWYLPFPEYLVYYLTGEAVAITPSDEFRRYIWTSRDAESAGVPPEKLPPFVPIGSVIGSVLPEPGRACGLPVGTPVVAAGSDFLMSLVGTDTLRPGVTCDRAGTSEGINHCTDRPVGTRALRTLPHVVPGLYNVAGILSSTGLLFEWFREISGQMQRDYGAMMEEILHVRDNADTPWFFPSPFSGGTWEFQHGMFIGLGAQHSRADMGRAVVLSMGFAVREALEQLSETGCRVEGFNACGGQARNTLWTQMKADIVGLPIAIPEVTDAELIGNVCCGLIAAGEAASLQEAAQRTVRFVREVEPHTGRNALYREKHQEYRERFEEYRTALEQLSLERDERVLDNETSGAHAVDAGRGK